MDLDALPAVLALHCLTKDSDACCLVPGLELQRDRQAQGELDFLFIKKSELYAGECKAGHRLAQKDVDTAVLAAKVGVRHFYFCTVSTFDDESVQMTEGLKRDLAASDLKMTVDVMTGNDLLGEAI